MRKLLILLFIAASFFSCKKNNGEDDKAILLSRVLTNGHTANRFYYDAGNKLSRIEYYNDQQANSIVLSTNIDYDGNGHITQLTTYKEPGSIATGRAVVQTDDDGKITGGSYYDLQGTSPNIPKQTTAYSHNEKGQLVKAVVKDNNGDLLYLLSLFYYEDGSLKQTEQYKEDSSQLWLVEKNIYSVPGVIFPKGLDQINAIVGPDFTANMLNETIQVFDYDQNEAISFNRTYYMSDREYGADGTLTSQTITVKNIKPAKDDVVIFKQYEYIKQ